MCVCLNVGICVHVCEWLEQEVGKKSYETRVCINSCSREKDRDREVQVVYLDLGLFLDGGLVLADEAGEQTKSPPYM